MIKPSLTGRFRFRINCTYVHFVHFCFAPKNLTFLLVNGMLKTIPEPVWAGDPPKADNGVPAPYQELFKL